MLLLHREGAGVVLRSTIAVRFGWPHHGCFLVLARVDRPVEDDLLDLFLHLHDSLHHGHLCAGSFLLVGRQTLLHQVQLLLENVVFFDKA